MINRPALRTNRTPFAESAPVVVQERSPRLIIAARQAWQGATFVETRAFDDAWRAVAGAPHGVLLFEVPPQRAPQVVELLTRIQTELPGVMVVASVDQAGFAWESLLRAAGAALVIRTPRRLAAIEPWVRRHLARAPSRVMTFQEQVWSRLPWPAADRQPPSGLMDDTTTRR